MEYTEEDLLRLIKERKQDIDDAQQDLVYYRKKLAELKERTEDGLIILKRFN